MKQSYIKKIIALIILIAAFISCDLERLEPALKTADGGGTVETFMAYTIEATDPEGSNVYGRVVFWKTDLDQTLVQISLYNTIDEMLHPAVLVEGAVGMGTTSLLPLDNVNGSTGELAENKFFLIADTSFYDSISGLDAHVSIALSPTDTTIVAAGDIGINADPVASN
ncbi:hypothetical protein [Croceivirga sp. JEA036]|uniref:hypothetical protein n=1 Tax=Croceivirga sp. JEA036 TaxID=2721162 RepID=UPI00143C2C94|nr:hypothetical protein [Croceivirga sp. JEA036]NJB36865.1 hypothetical protein [Croceivirga sp. JEA036]